MNFFTALLAQGLKNKALIDEFQDITNGFDFANTLLPQIVSIAFIAAGAVFVFMLLIGGIQWTSAGSDKGKLESAKARITNAIIGLVVLVIIYALVQLVNQLFGLNIGGIGIGEPPPTVAGICEGPSNNCSCTCPEGYYVLTQCSNLPQCSDSSCTCASDIYPTPNPTIEVEITKPINGAIVSSLPQTNFEGEAWDNRIGNFNGAGIKLVKFMLYDPSGNSIEEREDSSDLFCMWGNQQPCPQMSASLWNTLENGTYSMTAQAQSSVDDTWSAPVQSTFFIQKSVPLGNCVITGPTTVVHGTTATYTATWNFPGANLDDPYITFTRADLPGNWASPAPYFESNPDNSFWTGSATISFPFIGDYYVTCGAVNTTTGKNCNGNPWCPWPPSDPPPTLDSCSNDYDCGSSDLLTVLSAPPNTPTPTVTPTPFITPGPTALLNSSSGMSCATFCNNQPPFNSCLDMGTDGSNNQAIMYNPNTGQCYVQTNATCGQNMINWNHPCPNPSTGETHPAGWTYCTCQ